MQILNQQSMRLFNRSQGADEDGSGSEDGEQTLDLSVCRDTDGQVIDMNYTRISIKKLFCQAVFKRRTIG